MRILLAIQCFLSVVLNTWFLHTPFLIWKGLSELEIWGPDYRKPIAIFVGSYSLFENVYMARKERVTDDCYS